MKRVSSEIRGVLLGTACLLAASGGMATPRFEDATESAGVSRSAPTAGAAWGDFNGDGWPDLWIANHSIQYETHVPNVPVLWINRGDGTFVDRAQELVSVRPTADMHGAAWADFDNDGDQDLVSLCGAAGGHSKNANVLLLNENGRLSDRAATYGVDYPLGRGRTPLWVDANYDGLLDLLIVNQIRPDGRAPTALFLNDGKRFRRAEDDKYAVMVEPWSTTDRVRAFLAGLTSLRLVTQPPRIRARNHFPIMAPVDGSGLPWVTLFAKASRFYAVTREGLDDRTFELGFPPIKGAITDVAAADLNGDLVPDFAMTVTVGEANEVVQTGSHQIDALLTRRMTRNGAAILRFSAPGPIRLWLHYTWRPPEEPVPEIDAGMASMAFHDHVAEAMLEPAQVTAQSAREGKQNSEVRIGFEDGVWSVKTTLDHLAVRVTAQVPIERPEILGVRFRKKLNDPVLVLSTPEGYRRQVWPLERPEATGCNNVAAGDFDNDMDVDLYMVCTGVVRNAANVLLENDGKGRFRDVTFEAGAVGPMQGRGDAVAVADYDRDGFLDLFIVNGYGPPPYNLGGPYQLLRGKPNGNHWLEVDLVGKQSNRDGIGAYVTVDAGGKTQARMQTGGVHDYAQDHARLHFGLGSHETAERLVVHWPSGIVQVMENVPADQILVVQEPES